MDGAVRLRAALRVARGRRLRPNGYSRAIGGLVAVLYIIVICRILANLYLAEYIAIPVGSSGGNTAAFSFFGRFNLAWCSLFLVTIAPAVVFRGVVRFIRNERFALLPVHPSSLLRDAILASIRSAPVFAVGGVAFLQVALNAAGGDWTTAYDLLLFLAAGGIGFVVLYFFAWRLRVAVEHLELVEVGMLLLMVVTNPELSVKSSIPRVVIFGQLPLSKESPAIAYLIPLVGVLLAAVALLLSKALSSAPRKRVGAERSIGLVLYRSRIPLGLFVSTYAVELPILLVASLAVARNLMIILLIARVLWFLAFLFQSEQAIGSIVRAPAAVANRLSLYRTPAQMHLILCALSPIVFIARLVL